MLAPNKSKPIATTLSSNDFAPSGAAAVLVVAAVVEVDGAVEVVVVPVDDVVVDELPVLVSLPQLEPLLAT